MYKKFIQELRDYNNVIEFERKLKILNLITSYVNSKKVLFSLKRKNCKKGIILINKIIIVLNNKKIVIKYSINDFKDLNEFLKFIRNKIN